MTRFNSIAIWRLLKTMVLGYSRRLFARAYRSEGLESLLDGHCAAFGHFGGRTATILYDNSRTIVLSKAESTGQVEWNATFKDRPFRRRPSAPRRHEPEQFEGMFAAQAAWDATMGHNAIKALREHGVPGSAMVLLAGSGHETYGLGIQRQVASGFENEFGGRIAGLSGGAARPLADGRRAKVDGC